MDKRRREKIINVGCGLTVWATLIFGVTMCIRWEYKPSSSEPVTISKPWETEEKPLSSSRKTQKPKSSRVSNTFMISTQEFMRRFESAGYTLEHQFRMVKKNEFGPEDERIVVEYVARENNRLRIILKANQRSRAVYEANCRAQDNGTEIAFMAKIVFVTNFIMALENTSMSIEEGRKALSDIGFIPWSSLNEKWASVHNVRGKIKYSLTASGGPRSDILLTAKPVGL